MKLTPDNKPIFEPWEELPGIIEYFEKNKVPTTRIKIAEYAEIINGNHFVTSSLARVKANNGNPTFRPYLDRLIQLRRYLQKNKL